jgi:hypothetical protein
MALTYLDHVSQDNFFIFFFPLWVFFFLPSSQLVFKKLTASQAFITFLTKHLLSMLADYNKERGRFDLQDFDNILDYL